ncbi:MAG TPA: alpha/beta hydrolase [Anaerolineae bacterium]|jgi:pimeloyl-ACP methyl ester carboxylesterase|nr:alpha/beta hydrolase [Anaerolineae bacterium]
MASIHANGLDIAYTSEGEGPPLLLLHAATSSATEDWAAQRSVLRKHFRLYLPDARGHAATRWDTSEGWSHAMLLADAVAFADALGLERFHLAGLSMGAGTALALAATYPERVISAVLAAVGVEREPRSSVARRLMDPQRIEREDAAWAQRMARRHDPVQGTGAWKRLMVAIRDDIVAGPLPTPEQLRRARLPILLAYGDRDPWVPLEQAVALRQRLPDARLFVAPGVGHVVVAERPAAFNTVMLQFLRGTTGA